MAVLVSVSDKASQAGFRDHYNIVILTYWYNDVVSWLIGPLIVVGWLTKMPAGKGIALYQHDFVLGEVGNP